MADQSIIIIGAGLAGLSTGCYARMNDFNTHIFEHHTGPGGVCTAWKRQGYIIDGCINWLMSCKPGTSFRQMYDELGCFQTNRLMIVDDYCCFYDEKSGNRLAFSADYNRLVADMKALAPEDAIAIDEFIRCCLALRRLDTGIPEPKELINPWNGLAMVWKMRPIIKYIFRYNMPVSDYALRFKNPFLRYCIMNLFVPEMPAYFLFVVLGQLFDGQLGCVEGGSQRFSNAIANRYQQFGGKISYKALVDKIIVKDNRAVGIKLADGTEHFADLIISAADSYSTIFQMLEGNYMNDQIRHRFANWPLFTPIMQISFGVAKEFFEEKPTFNVILHRPLTVAGRKVSGFYLRVFNYDSTLAPTGKTVLQVTLETDYDAWMELKKDEARYETEKTKIAAQALEHIEEMYPGTSKAVEVLDVATPYTFWRYTRNYRGSYEGWLMTKETIQTLLPKTLPGLSNFYMAGQWMEPGGGIPPSLYSGRNVVKTICKKQGKTFKVLI
ncbi:MAG: NAD(P)/FAD-dependent oxidoreductase [Syntrophomonas sp.]